MIVLLLLLIELLNKLWLEGKIFLLCEKRNSYQIYGLSHPSCTMSLFEVSDGTVEDIHQLFSEFDGVLPMERTICIGFNGSVYVSLKARGFGFL